MNKMEGMGGGSKSSDKGMMDTGTKRKDSIGVPEEKNKNETIYPTVRIEKDMGMEMGQMVAMQGMVTGMTKGKMGDSTTIEVRKCKKGDSMKEDHPKEKKLQKSGSMEYME